MKTIYDYLVEYTQKAFENQLPQQLKMLARQDGTTLSSINICKNASISFHLYLDDEDIEKLTAKLNDIEDYSFRISLKVYIKYKYIWFSVDTKEHGYALEELSNVTVEEEALQDMPAYRNITKIIDNYFATKWQESEEKKIIDLIAPLNLSRVAMWNQYYAVA